MEAGIDSIGVTAVYFCHDGKGNFVMAKRSAACRDEHGRWDIGAGRVEFGEKVEATLRREVREEYCTDVLALDFLGSRDVHRRHAGVKTHWITLDFKVRVDRAKVHNGEPHKFTDIGWFTLKELPSPVHSQFPKFVELYGRKLRSRT